MALHVLPQAKVSLHRFPGGIKAMVYKCSYEKCPLTRPPVEVALSLGIACHEKQIRPSSNAAVAETLIVVVRKARRR